MAVCDHIDRERGHKEYREEMDSVGQWIALACTKSTIDPPVSTSLTEIHAAYEQWAKSEVGWVASRQKLAEELRSRGFEHFVGRGVAKFRGVAVRRLGAAGWA